MGCDKCLCCAGLKSLLCLATSVLTFSCRTRTPTRADPSSTGCWLSTLTLRRDRATWSSARETCWIFSLKVALQSRLRAVLGGAFGLCCREGLGKRWPLQCCLGLVLPGGTGLHWVLPRANSSRENSHSPRSYGPGLILLLYVFPVNEDWLEGRCNGKTGIFPKCFATQTSCGAAFL